MTLDEVRDYFGSYAGAARALGLTKQAVYIWKKIGHVPLKHQFTYQKISKGKLKVNANHTNYKDGCK